MWVGNNSYRVLDLLNGVDNYSNFYTLSFERNEVMICLYRLTAHRLDCIVSQICTYFK